MEAFSLEIVGDNRGIYPIVWGPGDGIYAGMGRRSREKGIHYRYMNLPGWKRGHRLKDTDHNFEILQALLRAVNMTRLGQCITCRAGRALYEEVRERFIL